MRARWPTRWRRSSPRRSPSCCCTPTATPTTSARWARRSRGTFREYERAATTEVDASLSPLLAGYLRRLVSRAEEAGLPAPSIMQSSGGLADVELAAAHAAVTVLSGPAGGAAGA